MSDFFSATEPMDIEGEAVCAVGPQLVTAEGEKGAGVEVKTSHLEADNLLTSDNREPTDDQEQVKASAHEVCQNGLSVQEQVGPIVKTSREGCNGRTSRRGRGSRCKGRV